MRWFTADLHIHTCLSPCADLMMSPRRIVTEALAKRIDIIAVTDHNSAENVQAVMNAARGSGLTVLPGMEVCTKEEVHVLAIFDTVPAAMELQDDVYLHLPGENDPDVFGDQVVANECDEVEGFQHRLLIGATDLPIQHVVSAIGRLHGLAIAAHVDRESFGIIGQLGFIPEKLTFDALEISPNTAGGAVSLGINERRSWTFVRNSDAHFLKDIGKQTTRCRLAEPTVGEIAKGLKREEGRTTA